MNRSFALPAPAKVVPARSIAMRLVTSAHLSGDARDLSSGFRCSAGRTWLRLAGVATGIIGMLSLSGLADRAGAFT
jgi:hypothetical protein